MKKAPVISARHGREAAVALGALVLSGAALLAATGIDTTVPAQGWEPATWPVILATFMAVLAVALLVRAVLRRGAADQPESAVVAGGPGKLLATLATFVGYGIAWQWLDFRVCTVVLAAVLSAIGGGRGVRALVVYPVLLTGVLWLLFGVLLEVPL